MRIAVVGGGITSAVFVHELSLLARELSVAFEVVVFDQGRNGVGGRASSRHVPSSVGVSDCNFDHGCQFFRADSSIVRDRVNKWIEYGFVTQWQENQQKGITFSQECDHVDFFGMPRNGPFFVGVNGMQSVPKSIMNHAINELGDKAQLCEGIRVEKVENSLENDTKGSTSLSPASIKYSLFGKTGEAAFHDTSEETVQKATFNILHDASKPFDYVVLTDISSNFSNWHRASAGVPVSFTEPVREKAGARAPLFTCMVAFKKPLGLGYSTMTFKNSNIPPEEGNDKEEVVWFASKNNDKPGYDTMEYECWTLVSTPSYAVRKITETPMQDPITGAFLRQNKKYLLDVPATELLEAFLVYNRIELNKEEDIAYLHAQRWGSALSVASSLKCSEGSESRRTVSNVAYDFHVNEMSPTRQESDGDKPYYFDEDLHLLQCGDMVSGCTPGMESAMISAIQGAQRLVSAISQSQELKE